MSSDKELSSSLSFRFHAACVTLSTPFQFAPIIGVSPTADVPALSDKIMHIKESFDFGSPEKVDLEALAFAVIEMETMVTGRSKAQFEAIEGFITAKEISHREELAAKQATIDELMANITLSNTNPAIDPIGKITSTGETSEETTVINGAPTTPLRASPSLRETGHSFLSPVSVLSPPPSAHRDARP